jgi:Zn-dependent M28 family amino/carboxypeptidase
MKFIISFFICSIFNLPSLAQSNPEITSGDLKHYISFFASDSLKGRLSGSKELFQAANFIQDEFLKTNEMDAPFGINFMQEFQFISGINLSKNNSASFSIKKKETKLKIGKEYITAPFSGKVNIKSNLVFIGYGISAPKLGYDDYDSIDVKGKIVLVLKGNPESDKAKSKFDEYSSLRFKTKTAKEKGAAGIIFINSFLPRNNDDKLMPVVYDMAPGIKDIGAIQIKQHVAEVLFKSQNLNLEELQKKINESKTPSSFELKNLSFSLSTETIEEEKKSVNVAAILKGNDPLLKDEYIVIGAHFDHLGLGEVGSLYRGDDKQIHNGADDNASGTAGVIELAHKFASIKKELKRSIIFVLFSGEELGLLGSNFFANNSPVPVDKIVTMINMDMIGRLDTAKSLIIYGTGTSPLWKEKLNKYNSKYNFKLTFNDEGYGPSDHSSFYGKNVPVLFFFTGTHSDYHRPTDDIDKINFFGEEKILKYIFDVANDINLENTKPQFVKAPGKESEKTGGWKVYVGTVPDFSYNGEGFKISAVNEDSPAKKGGMQAGDIMLSFGGKIVNNIYDYVYALQEHVPGDIVDIIVNRNGERLTLKITLGMK